MAAQTFGRHHPECVCGCNIPNPTCSTPFRTSAGPWDLAATRVGNTSQASTSWLSEQLTVSEHLLCASYGAGGFTSSSYKCNF